VLWSKAAEFTPDTSFSAWAHKVAYFKVLEFLKRGSRDRLTFSSELMETFVSEIAADKTRQDRRRLALAGCLEKLPERDRELVAQRYADGGSVQAVADEIKRPPSSIYRSLERIRQTLLACIQRTVTAEERSR
jgi:RNA polymerase sigma-70 factor (ECF subfamily)